MIEPRPKFFSICAIVIWVIYVSMHTGVPAQPAINIARLARGFVPHFSLIAFVAALSGTFAWLWLVRWRTGPTIAVGAADGGARDDTRLPRFRF